MRSLWILLWTAAAFGQQAQYRLGMTAEQVDRIAGRPAYVYIRGYFYPIRQHPYDVGPFGYPITVHGRKYMRTFNWTEDSTGSRLHPRLRLSGITLYADTPAAASTLLGDFAEAREVCAAGCHIVKRPDAGGNIELRQQSVDDNRSFLISLDNFDIAANHTEPVTSLDSIAGTVSLDVLALPQGSDQEEPREVGVWVPDGEIKPNRKH